MEECCVCLENCDTKTSCNHALCGDCFVQMKSSSCPLCRCYIDDFRQNLTPEQYKKFKAVIKNRMPRDIPVIRVPNNYDVQYFFQGSGRRSRGQPYNKFNFIYYYVQ